MQTIASLLASRINLINTVPSKQKAKGIFQMHNKRLKAWPLSYLSEKLKQRYIILSQVVYEAHFEVMCLISQGC